METLDSNRKAGSSLQRYVQRDQVATLPHGDRTASFLPELDFDDREQTWPSAPGHACSDFARVP